MNDAKSQLVKHWLIRAQHDLASARLLAASEPALLDTAIYHCQQAAEKAIKGYLVFFDQDFERTHDLEILIRYAVPFERNFSTWIDKGRQLSPYATLYRYPGLAIEPTREQFDQALATADGFYHFVLSLLPQETWPEEI
jgi:HEPN domain-containing protein